MFAALASMILATSDPAIAEQPAAPALYAIRDHDTTIYVFGTFHVLDSHVRWLDGAVSEAFASADELIVETIPPEQPSNAPAPTVAGPATPAPITASADFFSAARQAVSAGQAQGMKLENGADMVLIRAAAATGKAVEQLETIDSQLRMISSIPVETPTAPARTSTPATLAQTLAALQAAWVAGDHGMFAEMANDMRLQTPETYAVLFASRNARWSDWIAARMRSPGTAFVAIGAGHLAGPDSLLVRLAQRGLISRRVQTLHQRRAHLAFWGPLD